MSRCQMGVWSDDREATGRERLFVREGSGAVQSVRGRFVVSPRGEGERIASLLAAGAEQVLLGESALRDAAVVTAAVERHGPERIGVWLPVKRAVRQWGFDTTSNADFSVVTVANPLPRWLALLADGTVTDVDALWWARQMVAAGCATVLVSVQNPEDGDLLACAEMSEVLGQRFWLDAGSDDTEELRFWVRYGHARNLVLPPGCDPHRAGTGLGARLAAEESAECSG